MDDLALDLAFPPPVEETPIRLSYSSISTYELCPLQYKFRYVDGRPGKRTPALGFGESLHEALRLFHAQPVPVAPSLDATLGYLAEVWDPSVYSGEEEERAYRAHARQVLTAYHRDNAPGFRMAVALEQRFAIDVEGVRVSGVIDRMDRHPDGSYEIIDYKTSRRLPPRRFVETDLQLSIYYLAAWEVWGILPSRLTLYFLLPGQPMTVTRTAEDLVATRARIRGVAEGIRSGRFPAQENRLCDWCDYQASCPLFAHRYAREETPPDIGSAVDEWIATKRRLRADAARLEELDRTIDDYCDRTGLGRLFGQDASITRVRRADVSYDGIAVRSVLEPLGLADRVLRVDAQRVDELLQAGVPSEASDALRAARAEQIVYTLSLREKRRR